MNDLIAEPFLFPEAEDKPVSQVANLKEPQLPADPMISMIERIVLDPNADLEKLERMLAMKERHDAANAKAAFDMAFARASSQFPDIPLNGLNEHNKKPYALLKDILGKTRPVLAKHGFALSFSTEVNDREVIVTAELSHENGHTKRNSLPLPRDTGAGRNAVQAVGSSQTYGQRYTAQAILGLSLGEDTEDDGRTTGSLETDAKPAAPRDPWTHAIISELPETSTPRDKAEAVAAALIAQWKRMKGERQLSNEWDRRRHLIEGDRGLEGAHPDLHEAVIDAYEVKLMDLKGLG